jgi:hypothetical protein
LRDHQVDELGVAVRQLVGVVATAAGGFAHVLVAEVGHVGVVHLHIGAAGGGRGAQLVAIGIGHVLVERGLQLGVVLAC